jgi:Ran GTPase-activating protein (RanGAP) involved in mRNA processing and transport
VNSTAIIHLAYKRETQNWYSLGTVEAKNRQEAANIAYSRYAVSSSESLKVVLISHRCQRDINAKV